VQPLPPFGEIAFGSLLLVASTMLHGLGMYLTLAAFDRFWPISPEARARRQVVFGGLILMMLVTHMAEIMLWASMLVATESVPNFRDAFYYASVTYTTLGYEDVVLPRA